MTTSNPARGRAGPRLLCATIVAAVATAAGAQTPAPGLRAPATLITDTAQMPVVVASNDNDAAFLQGFAHARDRFWQIDFTRRSVSGTLAELVGPSALASDVQLRTLGLRRAAWATWAALPEDDRAWLRAYADGVNHWLATNPLPPEYAALELSSADPWTPVDSLVIAKGLAFQLSFDLDIDNTIRLGTYQAVGQAAGFNGTALFFEDTHRVAPGDDRVTIPGFLASIGGVGAPEAGLKSLGEAVGEIPAETLALAEALRESIRGVELLENALVPRHDRAVGSNLWAVSGEFTASGHALVANDPHLGLGLPAVFSEQHVVSSEQRGGVALNAVGVTVPGAPGIIQGCNEFICWGTTTNSLDVTDVFQETVRLNSFGLPTHTVHNGVAEPVLWIVQSFFANNVGNGVLNSISRVNTIGYTNGGLTIIVPRRNNGPILQIDEANRTALSVAYAGWGPTFEIRAFRLINRARNLEEFRTALSFFDVGSQNFVYGDVQGNIAVFVTGEAPIRRDLQAGTVGGGRPPMLIRDGSGALNHDWAPVQNRQRNQALPFEILSEAEMPFAINPPWGYVANANNDPIGVTLDNNPLNQLRPGGGIYYLDFSYADFRQGRLDRELRRLRDSGTPMTLQTMIDLQANNQPMDAELLLPHLLAAFTNAAAPGAPAPLAALAQNPRIQAAISRLAEWDFRTPTGLLEGWDPGSPPGVPVSQADIVSSTAATVFSVWRGQAIRATVDATLQRVGLGNALPSGRAAHRAFKHLLDVFPQRQGIGASGLNFFQVDPASVGGASLTAEQRRDLILLRSLDQSLNLLSSDAFAAAFGNSTNIDDYRWGRLHRITFRHQLGDALSIPGSGNFGLTNLSPQLPGLARPGGFEVLDASGHDARANSLNGFTFGGGPARRFVAEMDPAGIRAFQVIPGGNSGVPTGPAYVGQLPLWLTNSYLSMPIAVPERLTREVSRREFVPVN